MRKCLYIFLFLVPSLLMAQTKPASEQDAEIKDFLKRYYEAWNTMKSESADPFYAKDANLIFYDAAPFQYKGWQEYKEGAQKLFFDTTSSAKLVPNDDVKIVRHGSVAWVTLTFRLSAVMKDGSNAEFDMRQTSILEKREGNWLIVHEHISVPIALPAPTTK